MQRKIKIILATIFAIIASACSTLVVGVGMYQERRLNSKFKSVVKEESPIYEISYKGKYGITLGDNRSLENMKDVYKKGIDFFLRGGFEEGGVVFEVREGCLESLKTKYSLEEDVSSNLHYFLETIRGEIDKAILGKNSNPNKLCSHCKNLDYDLFKGLHFFVEADDFREEKHVANYPIYCSCINQVNLYRYAVRKKQILKIPSFMVISPQAFAKTNGSLSIKTIEFLHLMRQWLTTHGCEKELIHGLCSLIIERLIKTGNKTSQRAIDAMLGLEYDVLRSVFDYDDNTLKSLFLYMSTTPYQTFSKYKEDELRGVVSSKSPGLFYEKLINGELSLLEAHIMSDVFKSVPDQNVACKFLQLFFATGELEAHFLYSLASNYQKASEDIRRDVGDLIEKNSFSKPVAKELLALDRDLYAAIRMVIEYNRDFINEESLAKILKINSEKAAIFVNKIDKETFLESIASLTEEHIKVLNSATAYGLGVFLEKNKKVSEWRSDALQEACTKQKQRKKIFEPSSRTKEEGFVSVEENDSKAKQLRTPRKYDRYNMSPVAESRQSSSREKTVKETSLSAKTAKKRPKQELNRELSSESCERGGKYEAAISIPYETYRQQYGDSRETKTKSEFFFPEIIEESHDRRYGEKQPLSKELDLRVREPSNSKNTYVVDHRTGFVSASRRKIESQYSHHGVRGHLGGSPLYGVMPLEIQRRIEDPNQYPRPAIFSSQTNRVEAPLLRGTRGHAGGYNKRPSSPIRITYSPLKHEKIWPWDMSLGDINKIRSLPNANQILFALLKDYELSLFFIDLRKGHDKVRAFLYSKKESRKFRGAIDSFMDGLAKANIEYGRPQIGQYCQRM